MEKLILIKYGELTTKKANRKFFINTLDRNIKSILKDDNVEITKDRVRMYIKTNNNLDEIVLKLKKVFGIHGIVVCHRVDNNIENIKNEILNILSDKNFKTFKISAKRADKSFPIHTMELNDLFGSFVLKNVECTVDVHNPDYLLHIEIRKSNTEETGLDYTINPLDVLPYKDLSKLDKEFELEPYATLWNIMVSDDPWGFTKEDIPYSEDEYYIR